MADKLPKKAVASVGAAAVSPGSVSVPAIFGKSIGYQLRKTHLLSTAFIRSRIEPHGLQFGMWYFLRSLWIEDHITQRELSKRAGAREPTTLEQLRKMEAAGLVTRERDGKDRRRIYVNLTEKARALEAPMLAYLDELSNTAFEGFEPEEIETLTRLLGRVRSNLRRDHDTMQAIVYADT
jgi:DNA-binding MarR family transcriptional regulator